MMQIENDPRWNREQLKAIMWISMLFISMLILSSLMIGCRSTSSVAEHTRVSKTADTLVAENRVFESETDYRAKYDSLVKQMKVRDSVLRQSTRMDSTYQGHWEEQWEKVQDSMDVKIDSVTGRISYYYWKRTERNTVTHDTIYKERARTDSVAVSHDSNQSSVEQHAEEDSTAVRSSTENRVRETHSDSVADSSSVEKVTVKEQSWWERLKNDFTSAILGMMMILMVSTACIWWYKKKGNQ